MASGFAGILQEVLCPLLEGVLYAHYLVLASCVVYLYDYFLTIDDEIKYFWTGRWTSTRVLYFLNRCVPFLSLLLAFIDFFALDLSREFCTLSVRATFVLASISMTVVEIILSIRVYHLFAHFLPVQRFVVIVCAITVIMASIFMAILLRDLGVEASNITFASVSFAHMGCDIILPTNLWRLFTPMLILHTILFLLTTVRAVQSGRAREPSLVMERILRDGGLFYIVVFCSVGWTTLSSMLTDEPRLIIPAIFSNSMVSTVSIAMARLLLSIKSLAAELTHDPVWVLTNMELSCVHARPGATDAELLVDIDAIDALPTPYADSIGGADPSKEPRDLTYFFGSRERIGWGLGQGGIRSSRVGVEETDMDTATFDAEADSVTLGKSEWLALGDIPRSLRLNHGLHQGTQESLPSTSHHC